MDDKPATGQQEQAHETKPQPKASPLQRTIEHALSFAIVTPAIGGFLVMLIAMLALMPSEGLATSVTQVLAVSSNFWIAGYMIGALPSLITGSLVYPAWQRIGGGWRLYAPIAAFNCLLCIIAAFFLLGRSVAGLPMIGLITALATLTSFLLTRRFRA